MWKRVEHDAIFQYCKSPFWVKKEAQIFARLDEYIQVRKKLELDFLRPKLKLHLTYFLY